MKHKIIPIMAAVVWGLCFFALPAHAKYGGGTGEPNNPYLIYTAEQMNAIGADANDWDKHFKLMADIDLSSYTGPGPWTPLPPPPPLYASNPNPADGAMSVNTTAYLSWTPGFGATSHDVYFGTGSSPPFVCNQISIIFDPGTMAYDTKYYWRIDEVNDSVTTAGNIWSFTTGEAAPPPPPPPPPMEDIDLSGYSGTAFNIIGNRDNPFEGVFDGNGHVISNFSYASSERNYIGLFRYVKGENAKIKDLGLINPNVNAGTGGRVGSLAGYLSDGTITNCYIEGGNVSGHDCVGGLAGMSYGIINDCSSSATITGYEEAGGLIGYLGGLLSRCRSTGNVSGHDGLGGLVGTNDGGTVERCCAYGNIFATGAVVGGLVGYQCYGYTYDSYATGDVIGDICVGGLIGRYYIPVPPMGASEAISSYAVIYNCYSSGAVMGKEDVGGLIGYNIYSNWAGVACFWDTQTSGQDWSDGGTGLPTDQMQMASTFINAEWDFNTPVWTIDEGVDYPRLWWEFVPILHTEPEVTLGTSNTISWEPVAGDVEYYAECAEDANFTSIIYSTGWIAETHYEFTGLELGQRYWYSVKARNSAGIESKWSNVESSLQCNLADAVDIMLDPNNLKSENLKKPYIHKINIAQDMIDRGIYAGALSKLENDILLKTDGCGESGEPDKSDWVITCEAQEQIYPLVIETIEDVKSLMGE
jgi:hypothetical protein